MSSQATMQLDFIEYVVAPIFSLLAKHLDGACTPVQ